MKPTKRHPRTHAPSTTERRRVTNPRRELKGYGERLFDARHNWRHRVTPNADVLLRP